MDGATLINLFNPLRKTNWPKDFFDFSLAKFSALRNKKSENFWMQLGEKRALHLFQLTARRVPAYKDFLRKNKINPDKIIRISDFKEVPVTNKDNYILAYPLQKRCWDGNISNSSLVAASSGTSGTPSFWPRGGYAEFEAGVIHGLLFRDLWQMRHKSTLVIIGFPMGAYVSGVATLLPTWLMSQHPEINCTVISSGNRKDDILDKVRSFSKEYDQMVIAGHPFLIKDVIETGRELGMNWRDINLRLFLCSEGFSEKWRRFLMSQAGMGSDAKKLSVISTYGSTEMLLLGHETEKSIFLRSYLDKNQRLNKKITGADVLPNIFQFDPLLRYIESINDELIFTCAPGIPLIRYDLHDSGRVISNEQIKQSGIDLPNGWQLPFVTLNGRSDRTAIFNAANIYPEHIHAALDEKEILKSITGKFVLQTAYDSKYDTALNIHIELRPRSKPTVKLTSIIGRHVTQTLRRINAEFADMERAYMANKKNHPKLIIQLRSYQDKDYFPVGVKPKYIYQEVK
jgi:phenylacetate-CoA ligase